MFKVLLVLSIYTLTICHSATLQENLQSAVQNVMLNGINMTLRLLKEEYQQKIHQLKTEAMSCAIHGSCSNILKKFEHLKNDFYQDLEKSKNYEKRTLQIYHRQNNIRCIDCITDYIDDIFSEFCDEMDEELEPDNSIQNTSANIQPSNVPNVLNVPNVINVPDVSNVPSGPNVTGTIGNEINSTNPVP